MVDIRKLPVNKRKNEVVIELDHGILGFLKAWQFHELKDVKGQLIPHSSRIRVLYFCPQWGPFLRNTTLHLEQILCDI